MSDDGHPAVSLPRSLGRVEHARWHGPRASVVLGGLVGILLIAAAAGVWVGSVWIHPTALIGMFWNAMPFVEMQPWWSATDQQILIGIRLPRVLAAAGVGASLSIAGVMFQGLLRNPLADPFVIGASGGAAMGAAAGTFLLGLQFTAFGFGVIPLLGFLGSFAAVWIVFVLARHHGRARISGLILVGFAVSSVAGAVNALLVMLSDQLQLRMVQTLTWILGGISVNGWTPLATVLPVMAVGGVAGMLLTARLNALVLGERGAVRVGVDIERTKLFVIAVASLLTAVAVSLSGLIAFVGLLIPHAVRLVIGPNNRLLLPAAALAGAAYLILMDLIARTLLAPMELPVGIFTAIVGSPFFIILLRRVRGNYEF